MTIETPLDAFSDWWAAASLTWLAVVAAVALLSIAIGYVFAAVQVGPIAAIRRSAAFLRSAVMDLVRLSPRRVTAIARLAMLESVRRMVLAVFVVFLVILLFAGWYLDPTSNNPARLYLSFVLSTTSYLVLLLALFLSVFSLPNDIRNKTIYTIVTKPVRPSEIVLGRIIGFSAIGTVLLLATGLVSYIFVVRGLNHTHEIEEARTHATAGSDDANEDVVAHRTTLVHNHRHEYLEGDHRTSTDRGHWHRVESTGDDNFAVGGVEGLLVARVPVVGSLTFRDRNGELAEKGVSVGQESRYRSWIEGASQQAAVWIFEDVTPQRYPNGLPLEMNLGVFRTHQGDKGKRGILGSIILRNPDDPKIATAPRNFIAQEYRSDLKLMARELSGENGEALDLFDDLTSDGRLEVMIICLEGGQYYGVSPTDVYLRSRNASFFGNFMKGYSGIWLQMLIITTIGVTLSTFLNSAVAMLGTLVLIVAGFARGFMSDVAADRVLGGGPLESLIRLVTQANVSSPLEVGVGGDLATTLDDLYQGMMGGVIYLVPDLSKLGNSNRVANGFDIPWNEVFIHTYTAFGYMLPVFVAGYLFLKMREVAK